MNYAQRKGGKRGLGKGIYVSCYHTFLFSFFT